MSQHDFNIANQGFPATRADINNAFQAIASNSSGPTAPSTTYANMWWYDTTNNKMYLRNEADSAWIEVATIDQTNNEWQITTGVVQAKDSDGLALKTDDGTTRLFIKDSDGAIGIGTSSPVSNIDVRDGDGSIVTLGNTGSFAAGESSYLKFREGSTQLAEIGWEADNNELRINNRIAGPISFYASNAHTMRVTSGQDLHIQSLNGSTHEAAGYGPLQLGHTGKSGTILQMLAGTSAATTIHFGDGLSGGDRYRGYVSYDHGGDFMAFGSTSTERMRLDSNGNILFGKSAVTWTVDGTQIENPGTTLGITNSTSNNNFFIRKNNATGTMAAFWYNFSSVGSITNTTSSVSYNTSSDYRLKENVTDVTDGITRVKQLAPKRFNFIADPDTTVDGFLAHEAAVAVPEAVTGTKDAMRDEEYVVTAALGEVYTPAASATYDDDGNELTAATDEVIHSTDVAEPETLADGQFWRETTAAVMGTRTVPDYQGIDQSKLVPLLTAALQEAIAKIEDLETRVAALESA